MKEKLAALYALQVQDSAMDELKRQFSVLDSGSKEKVVFQEAEAAASAATAEFNRTTGELKDTELEQQQVETKRKGFEDKLYGGKVTNPKELQAMQAEVEMLAKHRTTLEDKIIVLMESLDARKKEKLAAASALRAAKAAYTARYALYKESAEAVKVQAQAVIVARAEALKGVDPALVKQYERLRLARAGIGISAVQDGNACSGCKMALPSTLISRIKVGTTVELCQNCGRMLCILPAPPSEPKKK